MSLTRTSGYLAADIRTARVAKALAHPARVAILRVLLNRNACVCGDIVEELPLAQSTVSQHLKVLKEAGLIQGTIDGPSVCYCADPAAVTSAMSAFQSLLGESKPGCGC